MTRDPLWYTAAPAVTTPTGTTITSPQTTTVFTTWVYLNDVRVRFPPGPSGTCGFYIASGGNQIIPFPPSQPWVVGNDENLDFQLGGEFQGPMVIYTANYGNFAHYIYFEFTYYPISAYQDSTSIAAPSTTLVASSVLTSNLQPTQSGGLFTVSEG